MCGFIVSSLTTKVAGFEPTMKESKSFSLPLGYTLIIKDVADWYSAIPITYPNRIRNQTTSHQPIFLTARKVGRYQVYLGKQEPTEANSHPNPMPINGFEPLTL